MTDFLAISDGALHRPLCINLLHTLIPA